MDKSMCSRNKFAIEVMNTMNTEYLQYEHTCPIIKIANKDKKRNQLFIDCDNNKFPIEELFNWFNVLIHDKEFINDNIITSKMFELHKKAQELGYITEETPKEW